MAKEIERKFVVSADTWRPAEAGIQFKQGYLTSDSERQVRIRRAGDQAFITVKSKAVGLSRSEFEYQIPNSDAEEMLASLCLKPLIEKVRYRIDQAGFVWEVDEFHGDNEGLVLAEIELSHERQQVILPPWVGKEVSDDPRYLNTNLKEHPFRDWKQDA